MTVTFCSQMYHYSAHGLRILSELALPELYPLSPGQAQTPPLEARGPSTGSGTNVLIELGRTPESLHNPSSEALFYQAKPNQFLFKVDSIASYFVEEGKRITIQPAAQATEDEIRLFLLGSVFGALLHQRGLLVLHGSAVQTEKGAVVFCGASGAGKSTLAAALQQRAYPILTDDVSVIEFNNTAQPQVLPGLRHVKLWADATKKLGQPIDGLRRVRPQLEKYALPLSDPGPLEPTPLAAIYVLGKGNIHEFSRQTVTSRQKFTLLQRHTYRQQYLQGLGMQKHHFQQVIRVGACVAVQEIIRPKTPYRLDELVELLERDFGL